MLKLDIYVDGSYMEGIDRNGNKRYIVGSGALLISDLLKEPIEITNYSENPELTRSRNVSGELLAVSTCLDAIEQLLDDIPIDVVHIYYDYEGIEHWVTGRWKANKAMTQEYRDRVREFIKKCQVRWHKVKAHSGITFNERADQLAAKAISLFAAQEGITLC